MMRKNTKGYFSRYLKKKQKVSPRYTRDTLRTPVHREQVSYDNSIENHKMFQETYGSSSTLFNATLSLDEPGSIFTRTLPLDELGSVFTRMSPGLDNWRQEKQTNSLERGRDISSRYISEDNYLNGQYSRVPEHATAMATLQMNDRRNNILRRYENYTNQNLDAGIIRTSENWAIDNRIPERTAENVPTTYAMISNHVTFEQNQQMVENKEGKETNSDINKKSFRLAIVDWVKEILKPKWKNGVISRDSHKAIVKKVVDKVLNSIPVASIPSSQEEITDYISSSESRINKLVEAYVEKYNKI